MALWCYKCMKYIKKANWIFKDLLQASDQIFFISNKQGASKIEKEFRIKPSHENLTALKDTFLLRRRGFETQLIRMFTNPIKKSTKKFQSKNIHSWNSRSGNTKECVLYTDHCNVIFLSLHWQLFIFLNSHK